MTKINNTLRYPPFGFVVMIDDSSHIVAIDVPAEVAFNVGSVNAAVRVALDVGFVYAAFKEIVSPCY